MESPVFTVMKTCSNDEELDLSLSGVNALNSTTDGVNQYGVNVEGFNYEADVMNILTMKCITSEIKDEQIYSKQDEINANNGESNVFIETVVHKSKVIGRFTVSYPIDV